ncbi:hypothetical protein N184_30920 [Sinorhizobium sp. GL28]|nr:hypothetical protein N184_30920 [Sinorhizobium sp. GL28]
MVIHEGRDTGADAAARSEVGPVNVERDGIRIYDGRKICLVAKGFNGCLNT